MKSNAISNADFEYVTEIIPKMGLIDTKTVDSTANVINKIESKIIDTDLSNILSIIVFIMSPYILYKAYMYHKKRVSKRAINRSQANDLDKI